MLRLLFLCAAVVALAHRPAGAVSRGEFWDASTPVTSLDVALGIIDSQAPTATFTSTAIDYPLGGAPTVPSSTTLATFLGGDAASIVGPGTSTLVDSVFRFTGFLDLAAGDQTFTVASDDGYRLVVDGVLLSQQAAPRPFRPTEIVTDGGQGRVPFELIYYERAGNTGVLFTVDGEVITGAVVPLPAGLVLLATGILALGALRRWA